MSLRNIANMIMVLPTEEERAVHQLATRLTHEYNGDHMHRDEWQTIGTAIVLHRFNRNDNYYSGSDLVFIAVDSDSKTDVIKHALKDSFSHRGCSCEYDCCGCKSEYVRRVRKLSSYVWALRISWSRNL